MITNVRSSSIYTFWSVFDEPIMLDGKIIGKIEYNEEELWDLSDIFSNPGSQIFRLLP
jgi:hypothetical protein